MNKKSLLTKFAVAILIASMIIPTVMPMSLLPTVAADDPDDWYMTVEGVLSSDTYSLYPYTEKSLDIGFSRYGEMIAYDWGTGIGVGLQYPGYEDVGTHDQTAGTSQDVFASELVPLSDWMNGWLIDIKYSTAAGDPREIWAFALFSDSKVAGKDWITMPEVTKFDPARPLWQEHPPYANPDADKYVPMLGSDYKGGRKTNGNCMTYPIEVLYDGPRKFIALTRTRISDGDTDLVEVHITIIFDKVEKYVLMLKDVKNMYIKSPLNIQFGNRGEWDLLPNSYVHFFTDEPVQYWDLDQDGNLNETEREISHEFYRQYMLTEKAPKKWWQDVAKEQVPKYWDGQPLDTSEWYETQNTTYHWRWHIDDAIKEHGYALAQVIHSESKQVGGLAVWPHPEFWSVQNRIYREGKNIPLMLAPLSRMLDWERWTVVEDLLEDGKDDLEDMPNVWIKVDDMESPPAGYTEPGIPFIIYEHDFELKYGVIDHYRIVSAYMLTDLHDGDDADMGPGHSNVIDRELRYILEEIFNSWDIRKAMTKMTKRWVQYFTGTGSTSCFYLDDYREIEEGLPIPTLPMYEDRNKDWDSYCAFSERVELDTNGDGVIDLVLTPEHLTGILNMWKSKPYSYKANYATGEICIYKDHKKWSPPSGAKIKVLWSSPHTQTVGEVWTEEDMITDNYVDGDKHFPLHHSLIKGTEEVFIVKQHPERIKWSETLSELVTIEETLETGPVSVDAGTQYLLNNTKFVNAVTDVSVSGDGSPVLVSVETCIPDDTEPGWEAYARVTLLEDVDVPDAQVLNVTYTAYNASSIAITPSDLWIGKELSIKFHNPMPCGPEWLEWKWTIDLNWTENDDGTVQGGTESLDYNFTLPLPADYIEKVWHHDEKAITDGYYVTTYDDIVLQYSLEECEYIEVYVPGDGYFLIHSTPYEKTGWEYVTVVAASDYFNTVYKLPKGFSEGVPLLQLWNTKKMEAIVTVGEDKRCDYPTLPAAVSAYKKVIDVRGPYPTTIVPEADGDPYDCLLYEIDWLELTDMKQRGNYIVHETETCDELVLDQPLNDGDHLKILYEVPSGRYEHVVVGKDAYSVDSVGAAMVTAAIKNKRMEIGIADLDISETTLAAQIPWVMRKFGDGMAYEDYLMDYAAGDMRAALRNDWCKTWPVSSSNMIGVGGPIANLLSYYGNDFTQAIYGIPAFAGDRWFDKIVGYTCWASVFGRAYPEDDPHIYSSGDSDKYGYATVSTTKDKNGTVLLLVWGHYGRDTYYASKWFDEQKYVLQHLNPHVTSLILKIDYTDPLHPKVSILEKLGTISEKPPHQDNPT